MVESQEVGRAIPYWYAMGESRRRGQDRVSVNRNHGAPPVRGRAPNGAGRSTELVGLRLQPGDAIALRTAADISGATVSEYVARLVAQQGEKRGIVRENDTVIAELSRIAAGLDALPNEVLRLQKNLNSKGGLVKSLFTEQPLADRAAVEAHYRECAKALHDITDAARLVGIILAGLDDGLAELRGDLQRVFAALQAR